MHIHHLSFYSRFGTTKITSASLSFSKNKTKKSPHAPVSFIVATPIVQGSARRHITLSEEITEPRPQDFLVSNPAWRVHGPISIRARSEIVDGRAGLQSGGGHHSNAR